jgi:hypothetical protein
MRLTATVRGFRGCGGDLTCVGCIYDAWSRDAGYRWPPGTRSKLQGSQSRETAPPQSAAGARTGARRTGAFMRLSNQRAVPPRIRRYIAMASHIAN